MTPQAVQNAWIHQTLYGLKMDYGVRADIYKILNTEVDADTGKRSWERKRYIIDRAIMLPSVLSAAFKYSLSFIAANKNFTYGGLYEKKDRFLILDGNDLPHDVFVANQDYIVVEEERSVGRYEVKSVEKFELGFGYLITMTGTEGTQAYQILELAASNRFALSQRVRT